VPDDQRSPVVSLALIGSSLTMLALGAVCWFGLFHIGANDHLVGGILIAVGMLDAFLGLLFMNR
jgi:hypothetical protein